jgi:hypothetical protein
MLAAEPRIHRIDHLAYPVPVKAKEASVLLRQGQGHRPFAGFRVYVGEQRIEECL